MHKQQGGYKTNLILATFSGASFKSSRSKIDKKQEQDQNVVGLRNAIFK